MNEMKRILSEIGLPFAYHHFAEGETISPPFLIWFSPSSAHFAADGCVYARRFRVRLELYTGKRSLRDEERVEAVLREHGIFYNRDEVWIDSEKLFLSVYEFELIERDDQEDGKQGNV